MNEYTLYYATNRNHIGADRWKPKSYGTQFSEDGRENLRFGKVTIRADDKEIKKYLETPMSELGTGDGEALAGYFSTQVKKTSKIEAYKEGIVLNEPDVSQPNAVFGSNQFFNDLKNEMMKSTDTLIYIHGYNIDWNDAVGNALTLQVMLNRVTTGDKAQKVLVVLFTWPSDGSLFPYRAYYSDRKDVEDSGYAVGRALLKLRDFFTALKEKVRTKEEEFCNQEIHLLCHSMGNYVLQNALKKIEEFIHTPALPKLFEHVFLCAADVDDNVLETGQQLERLNELCRSVSVYTNRDDKALMISDATKGNPERLGGNGAAHPHLLHNKICQIDCTDVVSGIAQHSYYLNGSINNDIKQSIEGFTQDDPRRQRVTTGELPNVWKMKKNNKEKMIMDNSFEKIRSCVIAKVRAFCFAGAQITDDEIGLTKISELHLTTNSNMTGIPPAEGLALKLKACVDIKIDLSGDKLTSYPDWTVNNVAQFIYGQTL